MTVVLFLLSFRIYSFDVVSLYPQQAFRAGRLLPFKLDVNSQQDKIQSAELTVNKDICNIELDPHRSNYFHILCHKSAKFDMIISVQSGEEVKTSLIEGIEIGQALAINTLGLYPDTTKAPSDQEPDPELKQPEPNPAEELLDQGRELYQNNCKGCHAANPIGNINNSEDLTNAFELNAMIQFKGVFSGQELEALKEYINSQQ